MLGLFDHPYCGAIYTWTNRQDSTFQARILDRILIDSGWFDLNVNSTIEFLTPEVSNHCPSFIKVGQKGKQFPKPFKFFNFWTKNGEFIDTVLQSWSATAAGNPLESLFEKLKKLKPVFRAFNKSHFSNVSEKVQIKKRELEEIQQKIMNGHGDESWVFKEKTVLVELREMLDAKESLYRHKYRVQWLNEGDSNTRFFQKNDEGKTGSFPCLIE
ncbi:hypothetical protein PTKIN_Ptkin01aG0272800 [Pterospermum kingtungense]